MDRLDDMVCPMPDVSIAARAFLHAAITPLSGATWQLFYRVAHSPHRPLTIHQLSAVVAVLISFNLIRSH